MNVAERSLTSLGPSSLRRITVAGHPVDVIGRTGLVELVHTHKENNVKTQLVFDINGQGVSMFARDSAFATLVQQADIIHADGQFVVNASRKLGEDCAIPDRSATTDMIHDMAQKAAQTGLKFFLLGGPEGLAEAAQKVLCDKYPGLQIVGTHSGYFSADEELDVIQKINASGADIVWVGLGKPREQVFCCSHRDKFSATWVVTCGGCFHYLTGDYQRAPQWMQKLGIEWLHRMLTEPKKLFWRYLTTTPHALFLTLTRTKR